MSETSTKPYLLRAIYEWCTDNGYTPYMAAVVTSRAQVPLEFVKNGEIVLNVSFEATSHLKMDNDAVHFHARFGGVSRELYVPMENVLAIYARENGQGMAFEVNKAALLEAPGTSASGAEKPVPAVGLSSVPKAVLELTPASKQSTPELATKSVTDPSEPPEPPKKGGKPTLTRVK